MNTVVKRLLTALVSLLVISYVGYQAYCAFYNPIKTMRANSGTFEDVIKTEGFVLHDETVITSNRSGVIDYIRNDGENVAKGGEVAAVYKTDQDAANFRKIQSLNDQIQKYQQAGSSTNVESIDIDILGSEIQKSFLELSAAADSTDVAEIAAIKSDMLSLLNKKQLATGEVTNFNTQIAQLQKQCSALSKETSAQTGTICAPVAGYFVSSADGFENAYDYTKALSITDKDVKKLLSAKASVKSGAVGKIISGYESYIVCGLSADDAYKLHVGGSVQMKFLLSSQPAVSVTVAAINKSSSGVAAVFKCASMSSALAGIRRQTVEIVDASYTGIQVLDSFVHVIGGTKGVFVRNGDIAQFKKLDPIYSAAGYTVSSINNTKTGYLQVYDEVIENGDDLYDGKVIK
jgi:hypothetical protein